LLIVCKLHYVVLLDVHAHVGHGTAHVIYVVQYKYLERQSTVGLYSRWWQNNS
jgi:hypothetical protein